MNQARLLSRLSTRQVEGVLRADAAANEVDAAIRQLWLGLLNHLGPTPNAAQIRNAVTLFFRRLPQLAAKETGAALTKSATWGHQTAAEALTLALPTNVLATAAALKPRAVREDFVSQPGVIAMSYDAQTGNLKLRDRAGRLREPVRDKLSPERQRQIFRDLLFPPPDLATVRDIVFSRFDGATFEDRLARAASLGDAAKIASGVAFAFAGGKNIRQIAKDILPLVDGVRSAARRIARTDSMRVIHRTNFNNQEGLGDLVIGWQIFAQMDENTRPWHRKRSGTIYYKNPGPGQKGLAQLPHPPEEAEDERERPTGTPQTAWNCLLPDNIVQGRFKGGLKSFYSGQAIEATCRSGMSIRVTPNHPILTVDGWVPAGSLTKGQQLVCYKGSVHRPPHHEYNAPASIEQVFRSLAQISGAVLARPGTREQLHGDHVFLESHVQIVGANGKLAVDINAQQDERISDDCLVGAAVHAFEIARSGSSALDGDAVCLSASGDVGRHDLLASRFAGHLGPLSLLRVGVASELDTVLDEQPGESVRLLSARRNTTADAQLVGELLERFPGVVTLDNLVDVRHFDFSGHVYDLETDVGYLVANSNRANQEYNAEHSGIVISNCRCWTSPVLAAPSRDPERGPTVFQQAQGSLVPDPDTYGSWWKQADDRRRKIAVGVRRYLTMLDRLQREPDWIEFMDPDTGGLLSVEQLKAETVSERNERVGRMRQVIGERRDELERVAAGV